jgi:hypothetical protein
VDVAANRAIVLTTIDLFGVGRCMFASEFSGRLAVRQLRRHLRRLRDHRRRLQRRRAGPRCSAGNARRIYAIGGRMSERGKPASAIVGVGLMGLPMIRASRVAGLRGHRVRYRAGTAALKRRRGRGADRRLAGGVAEGAPIIVLLNLPTTDAVGTAVFGRAASPSACAAGQVLVDFSTIPVDAAAPSARGCCAETGCGWVDAPVSGGPPASGNRHADGDGRRRAGRGHRRRAAR